MVGKITILAMINKGKRQGVIFKLLICLLFMLFLLGYNNLVAASDHEYQDLLMKVNRVNYMRYRHHGFLAPVSVGRVKEILSPSTFRLENGIKVNMLGIDNPLKYGDTKAHNQFGKGMMEYLNVKLKGRLVILRRDRTDFDGAMHLLRYVYLPGWDKGEKERFFNQQMIKDGYAKPFFEGKNKRYESNFDTLIKKVYRMPRGLWTHIKF